MTRRLLLAVLLLATWVLAAWARLRALDEASIGSDALGQYLAAWSWSATWWPRPPNPEAGPALWLLAWPLVKLAPSLRGLFVLRFVVGALLAPAGAAAAWVLAPRHRWAAALCAGTWLALDPGLVDTLVVAFRGYGAPELVAGATLALALRQPVVAAVLLAWASDQHPMATGALLGLLAAAPWLVREVGREHVLVAAGALALASLPRVVLTAKLASCGAGWRACLAGVALGSAEDLDALAFVQRALHDRFVVEHGWLWLALALGLVLALRRHRVLVAFTAGALVGVVALGLSIDTLRAYHLRILAAPIVVLASLGLGRAWPLALAASAWAAWAWVPSTVTGPHPGGLAEADALARRLAEVPAPLRVDGAWFGRPEGLDPAAVVLAAVLQGQDPERFSVEPGARVVLLVHGGPPLPESLAEGAGWSAYLFDDLDAARAAPLDPSRVGGAYDWMTALHPREAELQAASW